MQSSTSQCLDRPGSALQSFGNVCFSEIGPVAQHESGALAIRKLFQDIKQLPGFIGNRIGGTNELQFPSLTETFALSIPPKVDECDPQETTGNFKVFETPIDTKKCLLNEVFGRAAAPLKSPNKTYCPHVFRLVELDKGRLPLNRYRWLVHWVHTPIDAWDRRLVARIFEIGSLARVGA